MSPAWHLRPAHLQDCHWREGSSRNACTVGLVCSPGWSPGEARRRQREEARQGGWSPKTCSSHSNGGDCCWIDGQISVGFPGLLRPHQMLMEKKMLRFKRVLGWRSGNPPKTRSQANGVQNKTTVACPGRSGRAEQQRDQIT